MKTFILADKQDIARTGIRYLLEQPGLKAESVTEAFTQTVLEQLLNNTPDAVVILDLLFTDFMTEKVLAGFHTSYPDVHWLIFSDDIQESLLDRYCANPHFSFVLKRCEINEINAALVYAMKGENFICNPITRLLLHYRRDTKENKENLTSTEKEILKSIALGKSAKEIAAERNSSVYTIVTHKKNIFRKLEVNNVHDATRYALKAGLIDTIEYYI